MQKFKWIESSEGASTQVADKYIGYVTFVGEDMFGNKMWDADAYDKETKTKLETSEYGLPFSYKEDAVQAVEKAIRRAMK